MARLTVLIPALAALAWGGAASAQTLFEVSGEASATDARNGAPIRLSDDIFSMSEGQSLQLPASLGGLDIVLDRIESHAMGGRSWIGRLESADGLQRVILTEANGAVFGSIDTADGFWAIRTSPSGALTLSPSSAGPTDDALGADAIRTAMPVLDAPAPPVRPDTARPSGADNGDTVIDIGFVYTNGMADFFGFALPARAQFLVSVMDTGLVDSETGLRAELAWMGPVGAPWSEDISTLESLNDLVAGASFGHPGTEEDVFGTCEDLDGVCDDDADLSHLLAIREGAAIDLMIMVRRYHRANHVYCGVAYVPGFGAEGVIDPAEDRVFGVAVTGDGPDRGGTPAHCGEGGTFSHELGHNLGATHNIENTSGPGVTDYAYGHRVDCSFRTIMGYDSRRSGVTCSGATGPGNEIWTMLYSNPDVTICPDGQRCGVPDGGPFPLPGSLGDDTATPTNVARAFREIGRQVGDYYGPAPRAVRSAILPSSRYGQVGETTTAFVSVINPASSGGTAEDCGLALHGAPVGRFNYQTTDPATNAATGPLNTPVDIPAGGVQTFVFGFNPVQAMNEIELAVEASCRTRRAAATITGVNTFRFSASETPSADIVALAATPGGTGALELPGETGAAAFAVAISNIGQSAQVLIEPQAADGADAFASIEICETDPGTGACITARAASLNQPIFGGETRTYGVFVRGDGAVADDPARNRVFVFFRSTLDQTFGATSVAVSTAP